MKEKSNDLEKVVSNEKININYVLGNSEKST